MTIYVFLFLSRTMSPKPSHINPYSPTLLLFYPCLILILGLLVFIGRPLALHLSCCVMNKCLLSMFPCHVFFCGTAAKHRAKERGGRGGCISLFYSCRTAMCSMEIKKIKCRGITPCFLSLSICIFLLISFVAAYVSIFFSAFDLLEL